MPNEVKLLPCIPTPEMIAAAWTVIDREKKATGVAKLGPGLGVREIWQAMFDASRPTTLVTDEVVERVARALWKEMGPSNTGWTFEQDREDMEALARAALASTPTVVTGEHQSTGAIPGSHPADQAPSGLGASRFDPERVARMLRALAHDCENTDGWEDAAPTAHEAADCLLIAATRFAALSEWATTNHVVEQPDTDFESGWDNGYGAARRSVALHLRLASVDTLPEGQDAKQGLAGTEGSAVANGETPTPSSAQPGDA